MSGTRIADGPIDGTVWCVLDNSPPELLAPGGVVLCTTASRTPHPQARQAAQSAWELLGHYHRTQTPNTGPEPTQAPQ